MYSEINFSLNRIACPSLSMNEFFETASLCGMKYVELRNDLPGGMITDRLSPSETRKLCEDSGITVATINAVQKFNLPSNFSNAMDEIKAMADLCGAINCRAIILCPNNDKSDRRSSGQFVSDTAEALSLYAPVLRNTGLTALVEPLGFGECSIRSKKAAVGAINMAGEPDIYRVVHDTFHHYLGTDTEYYAKQTGFVHISGVEDDIGDSEMRDCHRVLVTQKDRIGNRKQVYELFSQGYRGIVSFEPFSEKVQNMGKKDLVAKIRESIEIILQ